MSLNFSTDTSTQLTYSSFGFATPQLDNFATSNQLLITSNNLVNYINTKQNLLTAATNLLGVGSAITALDYTKITLNKPTNFQADWTSTVINRPTNFQADWTSTVINKPTNFQADWTSTVINKPSTFPADMTNIYTKTETNNLITNTSNVITTNTNNTYLKLAGGTMIGPIVNSSLTASDFKGIYIMHATRQSHLPYIPDGKFYLRAPLVIDHQDDYLSFGARTGNFIIKLFGEDYGFGINSYTLRYNAAVSASHKFYTGSTNTFTIGDTGNITSIGSCTATSFSGSGANLTNLPLSAYSTTVTINNQIANTSNYTLSVQGILQTNINTVSTSSSNFTTGTSNVLVNRIVNETTNTSNYISTKFLKLDGTNAMTGLLSATTINSTGNVGIGITNPFAPLTVGSPAVTSDGFIVIAKNNSGNRNFKIGYDNAFSMCFGDFGNSTVTNTWRSTDFNIRYFDGNIGMGVAASASYKLYVDGNAYFNSALTVNGTMSATTFSGSGANLTNLPLSGYSLTGQDSSYLLKSGGVMSGQITGVSTINGTTAIFGTVSTTNNGNANTPQLGVYGGTGDRFILYVGTASLYPYSLGINSDVLWYSVPATASHIFYVGGSPKATISSTGLSITGLINASTNLQEGGTNLSSKYLQLGTANTLTGNLTINADLILKNSVWHRSIDGVYRFYYGLNDVSYYCCGGGLADGHIFMDSAYNHRFKIKNNGNIEVSGTISEGGTLLTSKYAQLGTANSLTGTLNLLPTTAITPLYIYSTAAASINNIELKNNANNSCYIGIGGTSYTGNYVNNLFLQSPNSLILNTGGTGTGSTPKMIINNSGNVGIASTNPTELLHLYSIGTNNAFIKVDAGGGTGQSGLRLFAGNGTTNRATRIDFFNNVASTTSARWSILNDTDQNATNDFRIYNAGGITNVLTLLQSGYVGIGTLTPQTKLEIFEATNPKIFLNQNGTTRCFISGTSSGLDLGNDVGTSKIIRFMPDNVEKMRIKSNGYVGINNTDPKSHLYVNGIVGINNGSEYAITQNFMASGSLTIGGQTANYGCGYDWNTSTAGLMMECLDNTEIMIHDSGNRLVSPMAYYGGPTNNRIIIGRDAGWGSTPVTIPNSLTIGGTLDFGNRIQDYIIYLWGTTYGFGINGGTLRYNSDGVHKFYCGGAESTTITTKGIIIGTYTNQYYPFIVNKTINGTLSYVYVRTGWNGGSDYNSTSVTGDTSASFAGQIHVSGNILNSSDIRIKKEINDITDDAALQQILAIQPKTYKYIDYLSKNNSTVYGFISQQVKEVIPHAVELVKDIIPNIYKRASCDSNIITLENDVSQELNLNDNIKIYDEFGNDNMYNITEINSNVIKIDKDINTSNIFVFGKEVDDFHTLKKDYIFTLNVCATQELYKLIQNQNIIIEDLKNRISILETK